MTSEWLQIRHKTQESDTFEVGKLYFKIDSYLPDFRDSVIFPYISLYTQAVAYTTYVESAARRALKNTSKRRLLSLGSLWTECICVYRIAALYLFINGHVFKATAESTKQDSRPSQITQSRQWFCCSEMFYGHAVNNSSIDLKSETVRLDYK